MRSLDSKGLLFDAASDWTRLDLIDEPGALAGQQRATTWLGWYAFADHDLAVFSVVHWPSVGARAAPDRRLSCVPARSRQACRPTKELMGRRRGEPA